MALAGPGTSGGTPKLYKNPDFGYKILIPSEWRIIELKKGETIFVKEVDKAEKARLKVNVVENLFNGTNSTDERIHILEDYLKRNQRVDFKKVVLNEMHGFEKILVKESKKQSYYIWNGVVLNLEGTAVSASEFKDMVKVIESTNLVDFVFKAVREGNVELLSKLYDRGFSIHDIKVGDISTAYWAIKYDRFNVLKLFVDKGLNIVKATDLMGLSIEKNNYEITNYLLRSGFDYEQKLTNYGLKTIFAIAQRGGLSTMKLLKELGANLNAKEYDSKNPKLYVNSLWYSLFSGNRKVTEFLLNQKDFDAGASSIWVSSLDLFHRHYTHLDFQSYQDISQKLIAKNGEVLDGNVSRIFSSVLRSLKDQGRTSDSETRPFIKYLLSLKYSYANSFYYAVTLPSHYLIDYMVKDGFDINSKDGYGYNALSYVEDLQTLRLLVKHGLDVNQRDQSGVSHIQKFVSRDDFREFVSTLVGAGFDLNNIDDKGNNIFSLHNIRKEDYPYLAGLGVDINERNNNSKTPLFELSCSYYTERVFNLIDNGAKIDFLSPRESYTLNCAKDLKSRCEGWKIDLIDKLIDRNQNITEFGAEIWNNIFTSDDLSYRCRDKMPSFLKSSFFRLASSGLKYNNLSPETRNPLYIDFWYKVTKNLSYREREEKSQVLRKLLKLDLDLNLIDKQSNQPFLFTVLSEINSLITAKERFIFLNNYLKKNRDRINFNMVDSNGNNLLHIFLSTYEIEREFDKENREIVKLFLDNGIKLEDKNNDGQSSIMSLLSNKHYSRDYRYRYQELLFDLLSNFNNINEEDMDGNSLLFYALKLSGLSFELIDYLVEKGLNINHTNKLKQTALMFYLGTELKSTLRNKTLIEYLLNYEKTDSIDIHGNNLLHYISRVELRIDVAKILLKFGFDLNQQNHLGETPLMALYNTDEPYSDRKKLVLARIYIAEGSDLSLKDKKGFNILSRIKMLYPRYLAAQTYELFLKNGADPNVNLIEDGETPLINHLVQIENIDLMKLALEKGASLNHRDGKGRTSLFYSDYKNYEFLKFLIDNGADVNALDNDGNSVPILFAKQLSFYDKRSLQLFESNGFNLNNKKLFDLYSIRNYASFAKPDAIRLILESGYDPNQSLDQFCHFISHSVSESVKDMIDFGVKTTWKSKNGNLKNAYHCLKDVNNRKMEETLKVIKILSSTTADINAIDTSVDGTIQNRDDKTILDQLLTKQWYHNDSVYQELLKLDVDLDMNGKLPSLWLVNRGSLLETFHKKGADFLREVEVESGEFYDLLQFASSRTKIKDFNWGRNSKDKSFIEFLIGLDIYDIEKKNNLGRTPLMMAAKSGNRGAVYALVNAGASLNHVDVYGRTALSLSDDFKIRMFLINHGGTGE